MLQDRNSEDEETDGSFKESMGSNAHTMKKLLHQRSSTDRPMGSPEDNLPRESQEALEASIEHLKTEISNLTRQSELSELELQSLRKQIIKENKRAQDLSRQVADLKEERDKLKTDYEQLNSSQKYVGGPEILKQLQVDNEDSRVQLEVIRRELCREKEMKTNLELQLQKTQDSNSELLLAVQDLDEMLEQKNVEISHLSSLLDLIKSADELQEIEGKCNVKKEEEHRPTPELQELVQERHDIGELDHLKQKITDLYDEIEAYREERLKSENYIEQVTQDFQDLKQENCDVSSSLEQMQLEKLKIQSEYSELESQVQRLEGILKKQTQELSESMVSINELSTQVKELEQELEKQAQEFENDLDAMTHDKIEQEQRAIQAEEALRKTTCKYASTAERLHEEFKRLSLEMANKYDENEKQTTKALTDADELHTQNRLLEDRLQKVNKELVLINGQNQIQVEELSSQLDLKIKLIEQLSVEVKDRSEQLIDAKEDAKEKQEAFSNEIQMLKGRIEKLTQEKNDIPEQAKEKIKLTKEMKQNKVSCEETGTLSESLNRERDEGKRKSVLQKREEGKIQEELSNLRSLQEEKVRVIDRLLSEKESLKAQHKELQCCLSVEESQKEILQKQVFQFQGELQKEEVSTSMEKKLNHGNGKATFSGEKHSITADVGIKQIEYVKSNAVSSSKPEERSTRENMLHSESSTRKSKPIEKEINVAMSERDFCSFHSKDEPNLSELLNEMALLRKRNKSMESELEEMQERYSEISLKFAVVEGERQQLVMTVRNLRNGKKN